jgi:hypothetical protein
MCGVLYIIVCLFVILRYGEHFYFLCWRNFYILCYGETFYILLMENIFTSYVMENIFYILCYGEHFYILRYGEKKIILRYREKFKDTKCIRKTKVAEFVLMVSPYTCDK